MHCDTAARWHDRTITRKGNGREINELLGLPYELLFAVVEEVGVKVLTTKMGVTGSGLNGEDTALDVKEGDIESTTTKIVDKDVTLLVRLVGAKAVGDGSSSGLVDDTEDVEAGNGTSILGGLTLVVVEVGGDCDDGLLDLLAELDLSNLLHLLTWVSTGVNLVGHDETYLGQDHGGDLLGGEPVGAAKVGNLDFGGAILLDDLEGPGLDILLDDRVIEAATNETPGRESC